MSDTADLQSSETGGERSHFSPGLEVLDGVSVDSTLSSMHKGARGRLQLGSLSYILFPFEVDDNTCFRDAKEVSDKVKADRTASLLSRITHSRFTSHGIIINSLPTFAGELAGYCEAGGFAIRSLYVQLFTPDEMVALSDGPWEAAKQTRWHTDARTPFNDSDDTILPPIDGAQKLVASKTISEDDAAEFSNGVQYIRGDVNTTGAPTFKTRAEHDEYAQNDPDASTVDEWGRPIYLSDRLVTASVDILPEGRVAIIPPDAVHRANPEPTVDESVKGRILLTAYLRSRP